MQFSCNLSPYSSPVNRNTPCPGLNPQPLPQTMDPLNMHTRGVEMMSTPTELRVELFMERTPGCSIMTPSPPTPYTPGSLSTAPSGYSSRRESTTQIDNAQTYSLPSTASPSLSSKITPASSFEAMPQNLDSCVQMPWLETEVAMYHYPEHTAGLEMVDSEQWNYNFSGHSDAQVQGPMLDTILKYDAASRPLQTFVSQQSEHPRLLSSQADLVRDDVGMLAATISPKLGKPFEYSTHRASTSPEPPSSDTSTSGRTSFRHGRFHDGLPCRVAKVHKKRRSDQPYFPELDRHISPTIALDGLSVVPRERHKDRKCGFAQCGKRFKRPEHLARHQKTHDPEIHGEKWKEIREDIGAKWVCPLCPTSIDNRADNLKQHIKKTHFEPTEKISKDKTNARITMREFYETHARPDHRVLWIRLLSKDNHATDAYDISDVNLWRQLLHYHPDGFPKLLSNEMTIHSGPEVKEGKPKGKPHRMWTMIGWSIQEAQHVLIKDIDPDWKGHRDTTLWDLDPRRKALVARELRLEDRKYLDTDMLGTQAMGLEELDPAWIALKEGRLSPEEEVQYGAPMHLRGLGGVAKGAKHKRESRL